ncbi:immunity 52 family protein [Hyalangium rubrum]|uniref:Immunity 52 family protein n=1 Tax=Hyalangium rubrum TaxID=3103134 RepID=A0ABU5HI67_9BACT|nr:immunity 52 family protein [Hyalangium sp. s54d21]MDY7233162.1 immunity 52 family protein [Hyalangium sp. s54d21]
MIETYYVGAYWGPRHEAAEACARRAERFFELLGCCEPVWKHWFEAGDSFEHARTLPFTPTAENFMRLFGREANQVGGGFRYWLWAGETPEEVTTLHGRCGLSDAWLMPACVLTPPAQGPLSQRVVTAGVLSEVVRAMALAWEPDWCVATSDSHRDMLEMAGQSSDGFGGWVTYFSRQRGTVPSLPAPARSEPVEDKGSLVVLTPERFSVSNPEHMALAARVQEVLSGAGLLRSEHLR